MKLIYESILKKAPWFIRWVFYIFWAGAVTMTWLFWQGWSAKTKTDVYMGAIASEVFDRKIAPLKASRDTQIGNFESRINSMDTEIKNQSRILYRMEGKLDQALGSR